MKIQPTQPTKANYAHFTLATLAGGAIGATSRYLLPTKNEAVSLKSGIDTFVSSAARQARGQGRSIVKYGAVGALVAGGLYLASKLLPKRSKEAELLYSKYGAEMETPDFAYEMIFYNA